MTNAVGIDFGTTKSQMAFLDRRTNDGTPPFFCTFESDSKLVPERTDHPFFTPGSYQSVPTLIAIGGAADLTAKPVLRVGFGAIKESLDEAKHRSSDAPSRLQIIEDLKLLASKSGTLRLVQKQYPVEGLIAHYLWCLQHYSHQLSGQKVSETGLTLTVPAKATSIQRLTMRYAAKIAGYDNIDIVEEPVAAFLFHRHLNPERFRANGVRPEGQSRYALVIDFGGGTCDIAVIAYHDGRIPRVVGRGMGFVGGQMIDREFVNHFWLTPSAKLPLTEYDIRSWDPRDRTLLFEYARMAKEDLSNGRPEHSMRLNNLPIPTDANDRTPIVVHGDFIRFLETKKLVVTYADEGAGHECTLREHLLTLIRRALASANLKRQHIKKLILAGGSAQLPGISEWAVDFLRNSDTDTTDGKSNTQLQSPDILTELPSICVAGGAAVHQLYRHHTRRDWRGAVETTLASNVYITHTCNRQGNNTSIRLAEEGERLPINGRGFFNGRSQFIYPVRRPDSDAKKMWLLVSEGRNPTNPDKVSNPYPIPNQFGSRNAILAFNHIMFVEYYIDEFGSLNLITWTPGSLPLGLDWRKRQETAVTFGETRELENDIKRLVADDPANLPRILELRKLFVPTRTPGE